MFKLDLSKFKKLSADKDHTVMQHKDGHQIKIAHKSLHPSVRSQLESLPTMDAQQPTEQMAKGGSPRVANFASKMPNYAKNLPHFSDGTDDVQPGPADPANNPGVGAFTAGYNNEQKAPSRTPAPQPTAAPANQPTVDVHKAVQSGQDQTSKEYWKAHGHAPPGQAYGGRVNYDDGGSVDSNGGGGIDGAIGTIAKLAPLIAAMAKGGLIKDPTQRHLLPGDKMPNDIEKNVVNNASRRMASGGGVYQRSSPDSGAAQSGRMFYANAGEVSSSQQNPSDISDIINNADAAAQPVTTPGSTDPLIQNYSKDLQQKYAPMDYSAAKGGIDANAQEQMAAASYGPNGEPPQNLDTGVAAQAASETDAQQAAQNAAQSRESSKVKADNALKARFGVDPSPVPTDPNAPPPDGAPPPSAPDQTQPAQPGDAELQKWQQDQQSQVQTQQNLLKAYQMSLKHITDVSNQALNTMIEPKTLPDGSPNPKAGQWKEQETPSLGTIFANKSTIGKLGMIAGLMLGGGVGGGMGTSNKVLDQYNNLIHNDLMQQQLNIGKKNSLLQYNLGMVGHMGDAINLSKAQIMDAQMHQLVQMASKFPNNPQIQQNLATLGMMGMHSSSSLKDNVATNTAWRLSADHIADPAQKIQFNPMLTPEQKNSAMKDLGTYQNMNAARTNILDAFDKVSNMSLAGTFSPNQKHALLSPLLAQAVKDSEGRITPQDVPMIEALLPAPTDGTNTRAIKRNQLSKFMSSKMNFPMLNLAGVNVSTPPPPRTRPIK